MSANKKLLVLPGDGIGPEVMEQVVRVVDWFGANRAVGFDVSKISSAAPPTMHMARR